ncbi:MULTISPECIES: ChuX/HutX family heme-like substrate-binding protein [unclassified Herbaspirillum]|uniref:hemin-degrading factor n=1 Tax=unclassified Herbaspirillum TaxID=2624150 RepID=UPI000C0A78DC|nr:MULTISPECIES: ChuX/HutX family heme-like substrate-binding protein [unclassified Herbaspirillum]MAF06211.1 hemin-degrading factor [Herbaspirillum sp.]MBO14084.1 hemin-degrading factor [Herbaspirillum sp.]
MSKHIIARPALRRTTLAVLLATTLAAAGCATQPSLSERWAELQRSQPKLHTRDAARELGVKESALLATQVGRNAMRLKGDPADIEALFERLPELGRIKAITRNEDAVLERSGEVTPVKRDEQGRVIPGTGFAGGPIDLRFATAKWGSAFAVVQAGRDGKTSRSLQFFDRQGDAVHKVYLDNEQHVAQFDRLVADFRLPNQQAALNIEPAPVTATLQQTTPPSAEAIRELRQSWHELTDVHQFPRLLRELKLTREQALQLIGPDSAWRIAPQAAQALLENARERQQPIMVFVSNGGMTQIYSGLIGKTAVAGDWYNVLDPDFNLHLRAKAVDHGWVVRRPTDHGMITSVEFYDAQGKQIVNFFSRRDRGQPETMQWRNMVEALPRG